MKKMLTISALAAIVLLLLIYVDDADTAQPKPEKSPASAHHHTPARARTYYHPVGHTVRALPGGHVPVTVGRHSYYYHGGHFYRPRRSTYVVVAAPIGARVHALPRGYVSFGLASHRYYYVNATFYRWDQAADEYIVVQEPEGAAAAMATATPEEPTRLFIYPKEGQSEAQAGRDRYECHLWAAGESGYDPTYPDQPLAQLGDYNRAMTACLEGRGYTVT